MSAPRGQHRCQTRPRGWIDSRAAVAVVVAKPQSVEVCGKRVNRRRWQLR